MGLALTIILFCTFALPFNVKGETLQGWTVEKTGGSGVASDDGSFRLTTPGGADGPHYIIVRHISPVADFNYSLQVRANTLDSFEMFVRQDSDMHVVELQYGSWAGYGFLLARTFNVAVDVFAYAPDPQAWYTLQLNVYKEPFHVTALVMDENGTLLGTMTINDIAADMAFENLTTLGIKVWGFRPSDFSVRNIKDAFANPSLISISTSSLSSEAGSAVDVMGRLTDSNGTALQDRSVVLSYTFQGVNQWIPISSDQTDENGEYNIQWINSASGTFTLKTEWSGDGTYSGTSNSTSLSFLPYEGQRDFIVESNSSLTGLAFNSTSAELSFTVAGETGTKGYVKVNIAKGLVSNATDLKVTLDGNEVNYTLTQSDEFWTLSFEYSHSTHDVAVYIGPITPLQSPLPSPTPYSSSAPSPVETSTHDLTNSWVMGGLILGVAVLVTVCGLLLLLLKDIRKKGQ
jgi:hypothetical protein